MATDGTGGSGRKPDSPWRFDVHAEKVVTFYLEVQGQLASRLWTLRRRERADAKAGGTGAALTLCAEYQALARDMGKLLDYACIVSGSGRLSAEG